MHIKKALYAVNVVDRERGKPFAFLLPLSVNPAIFTACRSDIATGVAMPRLDINLF